MYQKTSYQVRLRPPLQLSNCRTFCRCTDTVDTVVSVVYRRILPNCHTVDTVELSQYCRLLSNTTVELSNGLCRGFHVHYSL